MTAAIRIHVWKSLTPGQPKPSLRLCALSHEEEVYAEVNGIAYTTSNSFLHAIMKNFQAVCALENGLSLTPALAQDYRGVEGISHTNVAVEHIEQDITRSSSHIKITFDLHWDASVQQDAAASQHSDTRFFAVFKRLA